MKEDSGRFAVPISIGFLVWTLAFLLVGFTRMPGGPAELYLPMVSLSSILWTILIVLIFRWYARKWSISSEWFREAAIFGLTITILQFVLDLTVFLTFLSFTPEAFVTEYLLKSTVLIMYPLITAETIVVGYLLRRFKKI